MAPPIAAVEDEEQEEGTAELSKRKENDDDDKKEGCDGIEVTEISIVLNKKTKNDDTTLGQRIRNGECLVTISNLLNADAVAEIQASALELASAHTLQGGNAADKNCLRMPTPEAVQRHGHHDDRRPVSLSEDLNTRVQESILEPILNYIDESMCPSLRKELFFDESSSLLELFRNDRLDYSSREPAINVYWAPDGEFGLHSDARALTIFTSLSEPGQDYRGGGGTAFWDPDHTNRVTKILKPPAATVALWGGTVPHKGLPIESGNRAVFVASFSRRRVGIEGEEDKGE